MKVNLYMTNKELEVFNQVRSLLTSELIPEKFQDNKIDNAMYGHCYHAALAMYDLLGKKDSGYAVKCGIDSDSIKHYWLEIDNRIIDPTFEQYSELDREPPYNKLSKCDYRPSKATKYLIETIRG